jgi:hypothetical protein
MTVRDEGDDERMKKRQKSYLAWSLTIMETQRMTKNDRKVTSDDPKVTPDDAIMTIDDKAIVTFAWIAEQLGEKSNTISARWFPEKVLPVYEGRECPPLYEMQGSKLKPTGFGAKAIARYVRQCHQGARSWESWKKEVQEAYPEKPVEVVEAEFVDEQEAGTSSSSQIQLREQCLPERKNDTEAMAAALVFKRKQLQQKRAQLGKLTREEQKELLVQQALARKLAEMEEEEMALDAELEAERLIQQMESES